MRYAVVDHPSDKPEEFFHSPIEAEFVCADPSRRDEDGEEKMVCSEEELIKYQSKPWNFNKE